MHRAVLAGVGAEVPDHRLGRLGDAALRPGAPLRRDRRDRLLRDRHLDRRRPRLGRAAAHRHRARARRASASRRRSRRSTSGRPDVYEGAPTPITAFMAVATKAAAFGVLLRIFDVALVSDQFDWGPALATLATITIVVGNVGALGAVLAQADARLLLGGAGRLHPRRRGRLEPPRAPPATLFYLIVYLMMNMAAFARDHRPRARDRPTATTSTRVAGLGSDPPVLAWPLTIAMLSLAGIPATAGFIGKLYLIQALVDGGYTWLGDHDRGGLDDLPRLLPAGRRRDLDARRPGPGAGHRRGPRHARGRRRRAGGRPGGYPVRGDGGGPRLRRRNDLLRDRAPAAVRVRPARAARRSASSSGPPSPGASPTGWTSRSPPPAPKLADSQAPSSRRRAWRGRLTLRPARRARSITGRRERPGAACRPRPPTAGRPVRGRPGVRRRVGRIIGERPGRASDPCATFPDPCTRPPRPST